MNFGQVSFYKWHSKLGKANSRQLAYEKICIGLIAYFFTATVNDDNLLREIRSTSIKNGKSLTHSRPFLRTSFFSPRTRAHRVRIIKRPFPVINHALRLVYCTRIHCNNVLPEYILYRRSRGYKKIAFANIYENGRKETEEIRHSCTMLRRRRLYKTATTVIEIVMSVLWDLAQIMAYY